MAKILALAIARAGHALIDLPVASAKSVASTAARFARLRSGPGQGARSAKSVASAAARYARAYAPAPDKASARSLPEELFDTSFDSGIGCVGAGRGGGWGA